MNDFSIIGELNSLLPKNKDINSDEWASYDCAKSLEANNFDIFKVIELYGGFDSAMGRSTAYRLIYTVVSQYEKNIEFSSYYKDQFLFYVDALPSYIGGREVDKFIDDIFKNIPKNTTKTQKTKLFKNELKKYFICRNGKKPYWPQEADWPATSLGKPMVYISQVRQGDMYRLLFEDPDTSDIRYIEQYL